MRRLPPLIVLGAVLVAALPALAQSESEVDSAGDDLADARFRLESNRSDLRGADDRMAGAIARFDHLSARLEEAAFAFAALQEDVVAAEAEATERRAEVSSSIRDAYGAAVVAGSAAPLAGALLDDVIVASDLLGRIGALRSRTVADFEDSRDRLAEARRAMEAARDTLGGLQEEAWLQVDAAVEAANEAAGRVNEAVVGVDEAEARYQEAVERLEAALRSVSPRTLRWRPLVLRYFPEERAWEALQVIDCESSGRPDAVHPLEDAVGLFQFLPGTWRVASAGAGFAGSDRTDPQANVAAAAWLVEFSVEDDHPEGPWGRWSCRPTTAFGVSQSR